MIRLVVFIAVMMLSMPALAQQVLIPGPPTYIAGEVYTGTMRSLNGIVYLYRQSAYKDSTGKLMLNMLVLEGPGEPIGRMDVDPKDLKSSGTVNAEGFRLVSTDCSNDRLYPVVENGSYTCFTEYDIAGAKVVTTLNMQVLAPIRNQRGELRAVCTLVSMDDIGVKSKVKECRTPDGKWSQSIEILEWEVKQRA